MIKILGFIFIAFIVIFALFGVLIVIEYLRYFKRKIVLQLNSKLYANENLTDLKFKAPEQLELLSKILDTFSNENVFYKFFSKEYRTYYLDLQDKVNFISSEVLSND